MSSTGGGVGGPAPSRRAITNLSLGTFVATVPLEYRDGRASRLAAARSAQPAPPSRPGETARSPPLSPMHEDIRPAERDLRAGADDQAERRADGQLAFEQRGSAR